MTVLRTVKEQKKWGSTHFSSKGSKKLRKKWKKLTVSDKNPGTAAFRQSQDLVRGGYKYFLDCIFCLLFTGNIPRGVLP